ncbi:hypothetical protein LINPERPRIM_LOCUS42521 [Linum perenne]
MDTEIVISVHFLLYFKYINSESMLRWGEWVYLAEREERAQNLGLSSPVNGLPHIERTTGCGLREEKSRQPRAWEDVMHLDGSTLHRVMPTGQERYSVSAIFWDLKESLYVGPISAEPLNTTLVFKPIKMNIMEDHVQEASMEKFDMCWKLGACYLNSKELLSLVVVEGLWNQGFVAIAAVRSTIVVSIEVYTKPELSTNSRKFFHQRLNGTPVLKVPEECSRNETRVVMHGTTHFDLETTVMFLAVVVVYIPKDRYYQEAKRKVFDHALTSIVSILLLCPIKFYGSIDYISIYQCSAIDFSHTVLLAAPYTGPVAIWNTCGGIPSVSEVVEHLLSKPDSRQLQMRFFACFTSNWRRVHLGPEARDPGQFMRKSRTVAVQVLSTVSDQQTISRGVVADVDCFSSFSRSFVKLKTSSHYLMPCVTGQELFLKISKPLVRFDAVWSYVKQLFSKSERSSHLCRMIVDIVITELLRCMVLISCVSEGKEPFVRSKNFNLYVMDEAVSITFSLIQTRMMEWKISPLNEGLQAVSKNLGDIIESLANCCGFCPLQFTIARKTSSSSTESVQESADFSSSSTESVQESAVSYLSRFAKSISLVMRWKLSVHLRFFACLTSKLEKSKQSP